MLLRARKHKIVDFEGECLFQVIQQLNYNHKEINKFYYLIFQRRDDHVPIILLKPIEEIREDFQKKIDSALKAIKENENRRSQERLLDL